MHCRRVRLDEIWERATHPLSRPGARSTTERAHYRTALASSYTFVEKLNCLHQNELQIQFPATGYSSLSIIEFYGGFI
jgi:hypothetical protein